MSKKRLIVTAIILAAVLIIGGILAYFTDVQTKTNSFTMGNVSIIVDEGGFPDDGVPDVLPGMEFVKAPKVINNGTTSVYAFVEVTIPYDTVKVGTAATASEQQLFELLHITDATAGTTAVGTNSGWVCVNVPGSTQISEGVYAVKKAESETVTTRGTYTYVYAYVGDGTTLQPLEGKPSDSPLTGGETTTLFDKVRFINVTETDPDNSSVQGKTFDVVVSGYGIQTTDLGLSNADSTNPAKVWPLVKK